MTRCTRPHTIHELTAFQLGRPLRTSDLLHLGKDRPLTIDEQRNLKHLRIRNAERGRANAQYVGRGGHTEKTVAYYRNAVKRFERWARRAERLGLDKGHPPAHIAEKALAVVNMTQEAGRA